MCLEYELCILKRHHSKKNHAIKNHGAYGESGVKDVTLKNLISDTFLKRIQT